jgi:predicted glycosyltransferase
MKLMFELSHPKHYHQYKHIIRGLIGEKHLVKIIARDKDVLLDLLRFDGMDYEIFGPHGKKMASKLFMLPVILWTYLRIARSWRPDCIVSKGSPYAVIISGLLGVKTVITPDSEVVTLTNRYVAPRAHMVITPATFQADFGPKHKRIQGFFEDCYLHPGYFTPDASVLRDIGIDPGEKYVILRFIGWYANHDVNRRGFSDQEKAAFVKELGKLARVYISSEAPLGEDLQKYRIRIPPAHIHHALHFASLYLGDSQTMATEAALLGTPSVRCNSFVGENDMSNFIVLEKDYGLIANFRKAGDALEAGLNILKDPDSKKRWLEKRRAYYASTGDANRQIVTYLLQGQ